MNVSINQDRFSTPAKSRPHYDIPTAVTFLIAGLGIGSVLTMLLGSVSGSSNVAGKSALSSVNAGPAVR
jgi:hypothetical protein